MSELMQNQQEQIEKQIETGSQSHATPGPLAEPVSDYFVNRKAELELFWSWGSEIPHLYRRNYALMGLRRAGKSAILNKIFNRLFNEQTRVLPIYITFVEHLNRSTPINSYEFVDTYLTGYIVSYLAFRYRLPHLLRDEVDFSELKKLANHYQDEIILEIFRRYQGARYDPLSSVHQLVHWAVNVPRAVASIHDTPTALMIDEFQVITSVYNPDSKALNNIANLFQTTAETRELAMLISGSSLSMMLNDALGGFLSGRFRTYYLKSLSEEHTIEMVYRLGAYIGVPVTKEFAMAIWRLTGGKPYSVEALMTSHSPARERFPDLNALNEVMVFELTDQTSSLWEHYESEYGKYVRQLDSDHTTRKILHWITNHPNGNPVPGVIADALGMEWLQVNESLEKLYRLDILDRSVKDKYWDISDPLMREFLKHQHNVFVDRIPEAQAVATLRQELHAKQGEFNRLAGHFTEIIVAGLLHNFDNRAVEGKEYFGIDTPVRLDLMERLMRREGVMKDDALHEVDVVGEYRLYNGKSDNADFGAWLVSVRYREKKMSVEDVEAFIQHAAALQAEKQYGQVTRWFFSKSGFTKSGMDRLKAEGIYFSDLKQFNALATLLGVMNLP